VEPTTTPETTPETNGKPTGKTVEVHNPATGALIGTVAACSPEEVTAMVDRARLAQPAWEALGFDGRARILRRMQKWVLDNSERIIETIVNENG
jgi:acyl-CoA reductase-like NAD-dependent aldehyde dehydrogenase